jgi:hypothetical protein
MLENEDTIDAINVFGKKLYLGEEINNLKSQSNSCNSLGECYSGRIFDSSLYYYRKAQKILQSYNSTYSSKGNNLLQIGEAYYSFGPDYFPAAEQCFDSCYTIYGSMGRQNRIRLLYDRALLYFKTDRLNQALESLKDAYEMCSFFISEHDHQMYYTLVGKQENEVYLKTYMEKIYRLYYELEMALNNESYAFKYYRLATQWKDSIYNEQSRKKTAMIQGQFTQNQIAMLEKENEVKDLRIQQSRFFLFGMGAFIIVIVLMALLFIRQNKIRAEHKTVVLEQKLLRLQMNPHFIFNALSNILNLINRNETPVASKYLTKFSKLLRSTLEGSRKDMIKLDEEIEGLENYLELQKLRFGKKFEYEIHVDDRIDTESTMIPPLLVQPFIENAIEHGIKHKKTKGHVYVRFLAEENQVVCEIEDDGIGREKAWEINYEKRKDHESLATTIIEERIRSLNKNLRKKIRFKIIDLKSEDDKALGTKVVIALPQ